MTLRPLAGQPRDRRDRRGQSLVEFALVLPIFIMLLAGMVDFGLGLYSNLTIINAAREGARLGTITKDDSSNLTSFASVVVTPIVARTQAMAAGLSPTDLNVTFRCYHGGALQATYEAVGTGAIAQVGSGSCTWGAGDDVEVKADYAYNTIWLRTFGSQINLASSVTMRVE